MEATNLFKTQEGIFQRQLKGEISFVECWTLQKQVLEKCEKLLREQMEKQRDKTGEKNKELIDSKESEVKIKYDNPNHSESKQKTKHLDDGIKGMAIKEELSDSITPSKKENEVMDNVDLKYGCKVCNFRSKRNNNMKLHVERTHLKLSFLCILCDTSFRDRGAIKNHIKSETDEDPSKFTHFKCGACLYRGTEDEFRIHVKIKHNVGNDVFKNIDEDLKDECKKKETLQKTKQSINEQDIEVKDTQKIDITNSNQVTCEFCGKDFSGRKQSSHLRWSHVENVHMRVVYKCDQCKFEIKTKSLMYNHIDENHVHDHVDLTGLKEIRQKYCKYKCSVCNKLETSKWDLLLHMRESHEDYLKVEIAATPNKRKIESV